MAKINVGIKFRPNLSSEVEKQDKWIVDGKTIKSVDNKHTLQFEHVFGSTAVTEEVYDALAKPIVKKAFKGYNGTIFAYGQTSSGKTHTMIGKNKMPGIIPLAVRDIFHEINETKDREFVVKIGYIEIYNDKVYDLFEDGKTELSIFESNGHVLVNQKEYVAASEKEVLKKFKMNNKCKRMTGTSTNENSSRSHTIFRITIKSQKKDDAEDSRNSNLFLVDLAGSEKPDASVATTFNEGLHINQSLLVLGKIIRELAKKNSSLKRVNFRECKLARILSPALGGNSYTSVICNVASTVLDETYYTLCFAQSAEKAKTVPKFNLANSTEREFSLLRFSTSSSSSSEASGNVNISLKRKLPFSPLTVSGSPSRIPKRIKPKLSDEMNDHLKQLKLSESSNGEEKEDYEAMIKEKDNIIRNLQEETRELKAEIFQMRGEIKGNNELLIERQQENDESEKKIADFNEEVKLYSAAIRDFQVTIQDFEKRMLEAIEKNNKMRANFDKKFKECNAIIDEKDAEIMEMYKELATQNILMKDKTNIELRNYLKFERSHKLRYTSTRNQFNTLMDQLESKSVTIKEKNDEIKRLQNQLRNYEPMNRGNQGGNDEN
ncbi:CLUMA_CG010063, isoform A [Clunio marinus]|uniref:CLUMA_CG010063, isoform A n=1 Tax=Clunio marinus TaxID=568069 RepID=A0A1J1IDF4_9DIPT|nr:CLUMA_CG010063, isoform A [Clunio marinus]